MDISMIPFTPSILELDREMPVEVMRDFDTVLLFGKLADVNSAGLTIRRASSKVCFPMIEVASAVLVRCYDTQTSPIILRARVTSSTEMECTVGELELIPYHTQRKEIRYPLCPPAMLSVMDDDALEPVRPCQLLNISVSGACIVAERDYAVGQTLQLRVRLANTDECVPYSCKVTRVTPRRGGRFECGLLFERLTRGQICYLAKILWDCFHVRLPLAAEKNH